MTLCSSLSGWFHIQWCSKDAQLRLFTFHVLEPFIKCPEEPPTFTGALSVMEGFCPCREGQCTVLFELYFPEP